MTKRIQTLLFLLTFVFLSACKNKDHSTNVQGGGSAGPASGNEKPQGAPKPYQIGQFQKGQEIVWMRKSKDQVGCARWVWVTVGTEANLHVIKGDFSSDCEHWPVDLIRTIKFDPRSGNVTTDKLSDQESEWTHPNKLRTIYNHVYGSKQNVVYRESELEIEDGVKVPVFSIKQKNEIYLNSPGHAFHGVVLKWSEKDEDGAWEYLVLETNPPLPVSNQ